MSKDIKIDYGNEMEYEEAYFSNGKLYCKGVFVDGNCYGYHVGYNEDGSVYDYWTGYFLGSGYRISIDNKEGYCFIWDKVVV